MPISCSIWFNKKSVNKTKQNKSESKKYVPYFLLSVTDDWKYPILVFVTHFWSPEIFHLKLCNTIFCLLLLFWNNWKTHFIRNFIKWSSHLCAMQSTFSQKWKNQQTFPHDNRYLSLIQIQEMYIIENKVEFQNEKKAQQINRKIVYVGYDCDTQLRRWKTDEMKIFPMGESKNFTRWMWIGPALWKLGHVDFFDNTLIFVHS